MSLSEEELAKITRDRVVEILRSNGIPCFTSEDLTTGELEEEIKGKG